MISNSLGAMPRGVADQLQHYAEIWNTRGVRAWEEEWWMLAAEVGDEIGALMNAPKGSVACLQNVTTCEATVASCLDFSGRRNKVVYSDLNFPSIMYFWEAQRARGARVVMVPNDDTVHVNTERLLEAIDEETLIVPMSHVIFRSAFIQDVAAIVEKAHRVGAYVLLDSFQSMGTLPFDVQQLNVDFCTGGVLKWLCGGPGTGYLYVRSDLAKKLKPSFTGWMGHRNPFGFEIGPNQYADGHLPVHARHAEHCSAARGTAGSENHRRGRGCEHSGKVEAADGSAHCDGRPARMAGEHATRARAARRNGVDRYARRREMCARS